MQDPTFVANLPSTIADIVNAMTVPDPGTSFDLGDMTALLTLLETPGVTKWQFANGLFGLPIMSAINATISGLLVPKDVNGDPNVGS